ncbi:hypothetical protein EDC01DRAFT_636045 [Geopyxis carbonaria]|nr:hypothetical protein EDC01DRAFT_636045 [Geopyxis carbonaria]
MSVNIQQILLALANQPQDVLANLAAQLGLPIIDPLFSSASGKAGTASSISSSFQAGINHEDSQGVMINKPVNHLTVNKQKIADFPLRDHELTQSLTPSPHVESNTRQPFGVTKATESSLTTESEEQTDEGNARYLINKSMGVDPFDRTAVQERRRAVRKMCCALSHDLDRTYSSFDNKTWRSILKTWGWSREITEKVMKSVATDTVGNERSKMRRVKKRNAYLMAKENEAKGITAAETNTILISDAEVSNPAAKKPRRMKKPATMTYLRRQQPKTSGAVSTTVSITNRETATMPTGHKDLGPDLLTESTGKAGPAEIPQTPTTASFFYPYYLSIDLEVLIDLIKTRSNTITPNDSAYYSTSNTPLELQLAESVSTTAPIPSNMAPIRMKKLTGIDDEIQSQKHMGTNKDNPSQSIDQLDLDAGYTQPPGLSLRLNKEIQSVSVYKMLHSGTRFNQQTTASPQVSEIPQVGLSNTMLGIEDSLEFQTELDCQAKQDCEAADTRHTKMARSKTSTMKNTIKTTPPKKRERPIGSTNAPK